MGEFLLLARELLSVVGFDALGVAVIPYGSGQSMRDWEVEVMSIEVDILPITCRLSDEDEDCPSFLGRLGADADGLWWGWNAVDVLASLNRRVSGGMEALNRAFLDGVMLPEVELGDEVSSSSSIASLDVSNRASSPLSRGMALDREVSMEYRGTDGEEADVIGGDPSRGERLSGDGILAR